MKWVIDASTVLAVCQQEPGADQASQQMRHGLISTVNLSEVYQKSMTFGKLPIAEAIIHTAGLKVVEFNELQARHAAELASQTKSMGISFADRACLSLGTIEELPVLTGDRRWLELALSTKVELFRPGVN
ncbi:type II toxin-antitoxin system VapC family toxin [Planctomycetota bacterium]